MNFDQRQRWFVDVRFNIIKRFAWLCIRIRYIITKSKVKQKKKKREHSHNNLYNN